MDERPTVFDFGSTPDGVEVRHLRAFVAVAEELNFTRAADRLFVSQPALSRQIRALERLIGCELLRRSTHRVELTVAGAALLDRARRLLADLDEAVVAVQAVGGELSERIMRIWASFLDPTAAAGSIEEMRDQFEQILAQTAVPPELAVRPVTSGGVSALTVGEEPSMLFLHGGGYVLGSAYGYRPLVGALVDATGCGALIPDFRLGPEHPFPAALEDAERAYNWLAERRAGPSDVMLVGDSSGAGLVLALLSSLKRRREPMPAGGVLLCPVVDLSGAMLVPVDEPDPMDRIWQASTDSLAPGGLDDPRLNPLQMDLSGLPPLLIQCAIGDRARPEGEALAHRAREAGIDVTLERYPGDTHMFHIFWPFLPEAADALSAAGRFVRQRLDVDDRAESETA